MLGNTYVTDPRHLPQSKNLTLNSIFLKNRNISIAAGPEAKDRRRIFAWPLPLRHAALARATGRPTASRALVKRRRYDYRELARLKTTGHLILSGAGNLLGTSGNGSARRKIAIASSSRILAPELELIQALEMVPSRRITKTTCTVPCSFASRARGG